MSSASMVQQNVSPPGLAVSAAGVLVHPADAARSAKVVRRLRVGLALHINGCLVAIMALLRPGSFGHYGVEIGLGLGVLGYMLWHDHLVDAKLAEKKSLGKAAIVWFVVMASHPSHRTEALIVAGLLVLWSARIWQAIRRELA